MGSSVLGPGEGQPHLTHGVTAVVQGREAAQALKPAISAVVARVQATEAVESPKRATSAVVGEKRALLADLTREEANGRRAIAARRAGALPHAAVAAEEGRGAAAVVGRAAEEAPEVVVAEVGEQE